MNEEQKRTMNVKKITPVPFAQDVEPCARFWVERLGFKTTVEVPDGDKLAFAMLQKGNVELTYQSYARPDKDVGTTISEVVRKGPTFLYVEVDNLEETSNAVEGAEGPMPKRQTFYGSTEIGIKDPGGYFVTFAEFAAQPKQLAGKKEKGRAKSHALDTHRTWDVILKVREAGLRDLTTMKDSMRERRTSTKHALGRQNPQTAQPLHHSVRSLGGPPALLSMTSL